MARNADLARFAAAAGLSVAVHLLTAWALTSAQPARPTAETRTTPPDPRTPLGIDDSDAATITWIGFQEPTPNSARKSTTEQAAQRLGGGRPSAPAPEQTLRRLQRQTAAAARSAIDALRRALEDVDLSAAEPREPDAPRRPAEEARAARPQPDPAPGEPAPSPGNAEREADAFSIEEPVEIEWGKPVAAEGLEILTRTKGPDYSAYTRVSARPKPPLLEITFSKAGRVESVDIMRSSGYEDVDRPLTDAVYTWRARGERLDSLADAGTTAIHPRTLLGALPTSRAP